MRQRCMGPPGVQRRFRGIPGPGRRDTEFQSVNGSENGRKMEKLAKIREIPKKSQDPNPARNILFGTTDNFFKIKNGTLVHFGQRFDF